MIQCDVVQVRVTEGAGKGDEPTLHVPPEVASSGIGAGDRMELFRTPSRNGEPLVVLMLLYVDDRSPLDLLSTESMAEEVARTFVSAIGLVLAVPITTAIAAWIAGPVMEEAPTRPGT